jgi:hypothetical protein
MVPAPVNVAPLTVLPAAGDSTPVTVSVPVTAILAAGENVEEAETVMAAQLMPTLVDWAPDPVKFTVRLVKVLVVNENWVAKSPIMLAFMVPPPVMVPPLTVLPEPGDNVPVTVSVPETVIFAVVATVEPEFTVMAAQLMTTFVDWDPDPAKFTVLLVNVLVVNAYWVAKAPTIVIFIVPVPVMVPPPRVLLAPGVSVPFTVKVLDTVTLAEVVTVVPLFIVRFAHDRVELISCVPEP